uniref:Transposase n=2 Tax=Candidatus Kentrum sp. TUN TaxID=2126343 RepID=A0A451A664_9GAMM|nr:MAG: Transposase [Candidatus Kentron sp. TUN]
MPHYSEEFKEKLVREMMSPGGRSVSEIHQASGISENTLYSWKNKYGVEQEAEPGRTGKPENWDGERKLLVLTETAGLNEQELSEYCRENGLYVEQIERWREPAIAGTESGSLLTKGQRQEWQRDKKRLCNIKKELRRKEKALAEGIRREGLILHSDNGSPMRGATMLATLQKLGVIPSFSRPSVAKYVANPPSYSKQ